ncbi:hypothetical protein [Streptomyces sp. NRRL S-237]|uniref:hypothetical protein n=1 Tax=Streptomyces sp. NRRL S-237 TaxID=1463895 RepID=UPI0004C48409|nr:hypothetical protein [Streptomyces sp. NRRL S-237]
MAGFMNKARHETDSIGNLHPDLVHAGMLTGACAVVTRTAPTGLERPGPTPSRRSSGLQDYYERYAPSTTPGTAVPAGGCHR